MSAFDEDPSENKSELDLCVDEINELQSRIGKAMTLIERYGGIDGGHHKQWVIDQVIRELLADDYDYDAWVKDMCNGDEGENTYEWDEGIAP